MGSGQSGGAFILERVSSSQNDRWEYTKIGGMRLGSWIAYLVSYCSCSVLLSLSFSSPLSFARSFPLSPAFPRFVKSPFVLPACFYDHDRINTQPNPGTFVLLLIRVSDANSIQDPQARHTLSDR